MTLRDSYRAINSAFDEFLYAEIGRSTEGMSLSVISGLARLGIDPWLEAARLAELPKAAAIPSLAGLLDQLRTEDIELRDSAGIAGRLVNLLPRGGGPTLAHGAKPGLVRALSPIVVWLLLLLLIGATALTYYRFADDGRATSEIAGATRSTAILGGDA